VAPDEILGAQPVGLPVMVPLAAVMEQGVSGGAPVQGFVGVHGRLRKGSVGPKQALVPLLGVNAAVRLA
jgi:hypothetical protein